MVFAIEEYVPRSCQMVRKEVDSELLERLETARNDKGLTVEQLIRQAAGHLPTRGKNLRRELAALVRGEPPTSQEHLLTILGALCRTLGLHREELMPAKPRAKGIRSQRQLDAAGARKEREGRLRKLFGRRLDAARVEKGWNMSELARRATLHLATPEPGQKQGEAIGRDLISNYCRGLGRPRREYLVAIAKALGMTPQELMPATETEPIEQFPAFKLEEAESGRAWIRLNRNVSWETATKILQLLKEENSPVAAFRKEGRRF